MPATLSAILEAFYLDRKAAGISPRTLEGYRTHLAHLAAFFEDRKIMRLADVTGHDLAAYQSQLLLARGPQGEPLSASTQMHYLNTVKGVFRYLARTGKLLVDPAQHVVLPQVRRHLRAQILDEAAVSRLLATPRTTTVLGLRDRAMFEVLYSTGLRASELINLDTHDILRGEGEVRVRRGKGRKGRVVPIGEAACRWVERYLESARLHLMRRASETALFLSQWGRRLDRMNLARLVRTYAKAAGLPGRVTTHGLRHAFATHLLRGGASVRHVQDMLGHACLSTTQIYTRVEISDLKEIHRRCHPRGRTVSRDNASRGERPPSPRSRTR